MLAGPSIVTCFNADGGMGQCLRGEMVDAGILPQPAVAAADPAAPAAETAAIATPEPIMDIAAPDATEPSAEASDALVAASFGLLRAEPDGSVVIAGSGTPGSEVEVYANEDLLGTAKVEPSGDWVLVPDEPLPPGGLEITLGESGKDGRAEESFVVAINEDKSSEPLVVASTPGAASEVLQGLAAPEQLASADPIQSPAPEPAPAPAPAPVQEAVAPDAPAVPVPAATQAEAAPSQPAPEPATAQTAGAPVEPAPATEPEDGAAAPASTPEPAPVADPAPPAPEPESAPAAVASVEPPPAAPEPLATPLEGAAPTIDAIEIEGDSTYFAGAGPEGADIRLYVDDQFVSDAKVSDGRWLVEAGPVLKQPSQRVRIDMLQSGSAKVASRAEVDFVVEVPGEEPPLAVADADAPAPAPATPDAQDSASPPAAEPQTAPAPEAQAAVPQVAPATSVDTPAAIAPAPSPSPAATPPQAEPTQPVPPAATPSPAATADAPPEPAQPATTTEAEVPTMVAVSVGGPDAERFAAGKAIIRRGDNLWTIARRVYGQGMKYTTIYEANTGQIRDPDRIYPGQVFALPEDSEN
ncbi:LysM peptidoglycan-binding domain-containing protein [Devosia naphthalenivorans]|uniref:LysM peptidoglycan-binding domain-containing protein n=1 Tax=Devosia naphthalenivorans TaxID=2082392 RepID=UPI000D36BB3C|nr:LysM peptidoglycan-binding domain-containing protein [Devosia naphthalenivorans]